MESKIYIVVRSISFSNAVGGMEKAAKEHLLEMFHHGLKIVLVCPKKKLIGNVPEGVEYIDVPWPIWDKYKILMTMGIAYTLWCKKVAMLLNKKMRGNDTLHCHGASAGVLGFLNANVIKKINTVVNPHGMEEFGTGSLFRLINRYFTKKLIKKAKLAKAIISTDKSLINVVKINLCVDDDKIVLIPNTIDVEKIKGYIHHENMTRQTEPLSSKRTIKIVSIGRIEYNKGYDILARSLSKIQKEFPLSEIKWQHYGKGKKKKEVLNICRRANININITENATDAEVHNGLDTCDIFVQPSRYEGSSLTTLEAMVHGCLIIGTPVGGIPDKIINMHTGLLCNASTVFDLYETLRLAIKGTELYNLKRNAQVYAEEMYDKRIATEKYLQLYKSLQIK